MKDHKEMTNAEYTPLAVEITVSNFERSLSFYQDKLGFEVARIYKDEQYTFASLFFNGSLLMIKQDDRVAKPKNPIIQIRFIFSNVEELNQYYEKIKKNGMKIYKPLERQYYGLYRFSVEDPDGYEIKFGAK